MKTNLIQTCLLAAALLALPAVVQAQFTYTTNNGTITITGYTGSGGAVTIPDTINGLPVTSIGDDAFEGTALTSVTIPGNVTDIGFDAFFYCNNLTSVTIPNSVTNIGDEAFANCYNLTAITVDTNNPVYSSVNGVLFDKNQTTLVEYPAGDPANYTIPDSVTGIGDEAFDFCFNLANVTIGSSVTNIGDEAFANSGLTTVFFTGNAPSVGQHAFYSFHYDGTGVSWFLEPATVYYLSGTMGWSNTFGGLPTVMLNAPPQFGTTADGWNYVSDQVKNTLITGYAGSNNAVVIPSTINGLPVTGIAPYAFKDNPSLVSVTIPNTVTSIGDYAFYYCNNLTSVTMGNSVASIGDEAFFTCFNLNSVYFSGNAPSVSEYAFDGENPTIYYVFGTSDWSSMFAGFATALWDPPTRLEYAINDGAVTITSYAGSGGTVSIPATINGLPVTSIGNAAFYDDNSFNDNSLTSVTIPDSVTNIGDEAFVNCAELTSVYFGGNAPVAHSSAFVIYGYPYYDPATVYYLQGTLGWSNTFAGRPTALWLPQAETDDGSFGVRTNQFGFNINWASGQTVVVEACTNLQNPGWLPVSTNTLTGGVSYFSDPQSPNLPGRYYRLRSP
jgi:BspA type Leucine rich repeat region (6 copies)